MIEIEKPGDAVSLARAFLLFNWDSVVPYIRSLHKNIYYMQVHELTFFVRKIYNRVTHKITENVI